MKFIISLMLFSTSLMASPIRVFYETEPSRAQVVRDIFTNDYQIPEDLIVMKQVQNCDEMRNRGKLDLCLKNNGDLLVVSVDRGFVNESLKIFRAP